MNITRAQAPDVTLTPSPGAAPSPAPRPARRAPMADSHTRTIAKSLSWRFGGFIMTVAVAWAVTGSPGIAASIGLADTLVKIGAYYLHERMWLRIRFGQPKAPEYDI